ncbi:MAG: flagellar basal-body rod protein FlgG [Chthoniobacterales bacterium]|nr:flagellar basal-body rod protein FlgG [Chthoniobacterales bacterium]MCX7713231.1 flagellar basal-body rod protein FlgG [Chthoniobacterales bacterium]
MIPSLYSGATGLNAQQLNLNTISHNLANVSTTGFKKSKVEFQDLIYQTEREMGAEAGAGNITPVGLETGTGSRVISTTKVFSQGQLTQTGEKLDLAIDGDGFFEIERPDGTLAYTRDGSFKLSPNGEVVTKDGYRVLSGFQPIPPEATGISIAPNGEVTVVTPNGTQNFQIQLTKFNNPAGLKSIGGNLYVETPASGTPNAGTPGQNAIGRVMQGYLENSNVNVAEEMVNMILAQRAYEINSKAIQTSDRMLEIINQLKRA